MASFYNNVNGNSSAPITNYASLAANQITFGRGAIGHVIINAASSTMEGSFKTDMPDGKYCNVVMGAMDGTECIGDP